MGKIIKTVAATAITAAAVPYVVYHEVIEKNGKMFKAINYVMDKQAAKNNTETDPREAWWNEQVFEEYTITGENGNQLKGYLLKAEKETDKFVFCSHGYRCFGKREIRYIAKFFHDSGLNIFFVDHCSSGESEGNYIGFGYFEHLDCMKWLNFMLDKFGNDIKIFLYGVSMGSATVMLMTGDSDLPENVKFTVADCGYTSATNEFYDVIKPLGILRKPIIDGANFFTKKIAGYDFNDTNALEAVKKAKIPMLFIHGKDDWFVPTYMGGELYEACSSEYKDILYVDGAQHAESYFKNSADYEAKVTEYIEKYL